MNDRTLRTVVTGLSGLLVLVIAVTLLIMVGRGGSASPSAPPVALASPSVGATLTPIESAQPSPTASPDATPSPAAEASPSVTPSGSPGAAAPATLTFVGLKLDADQDPGGDARVITFRSDGAGTVTAKLTSKSPQGRTHMCFLVGTRSSAARTAVRHVHRQDQSGACDLEGHAPGRGQRCPDGRPDRHVPGGRAIGEDRACALRWHRLSRQNGIQARFSARAAGEVRLVADWGGHPFLYEVDLFDESGGQGSTSQHAVSQEPSTNTDQAMPVTPGNWRLVLQNTEDGFGTTDLTATISWP